MIGQHALPIIVIKTSPLVQYICLKCMTETLKITKGISLAYFNIHTFDDC